MLTTKMFARIAMHCWRACGACSSILPTFPCWVEGLLLKLLILDRDGVINHDSDAYIKSVEEWLPLPGSIEAIAQLSKAGWTVAVATNQSGIARGYYGLAVLEAMHERLRELVAEQGGEVGLIVYCPHGPDERSEEHTSELQSLMRISYAVFCLKKKNTHNTTKR